MRIKAGVEFPLNLPLDRYKMQLQFKREKYLGEIETLTREMLLTRKFYRGYNVYGTREMNFELDFSILKDIPRDGLVLELPFQEGSGTTCRDWSGNNNNATLYGGVTWKQLASGKWVLELDGSTGYGEIPHSTSLIIDEEITIIAWGFIKSFDTHFEMVNKAAWNMWRFMVNRIDKKPRLIQNTDVGVLSYVGEPIEEANLLNRWNQFAVSCKSGNIIFCINGEVDKTFVDTYNTLVTNISSVYIGRYIDSYATGQFGLVRIYNKALTQSELKAIYNAEKPIFLE
jgi:arabinan endo-1,5-alpha-L-arabinosidase